MTESRRRRRPRPRPRWAWPCADALVWVLAVHAAVWLRYDFRVELLLVPATASFALAAGAGQVAVGHLVGPYTVRHRQGSFEEVLDVARTVVLVALPFLVVSLLVYPPPVPRSTAVSSGALALLTMLACRFVVRARATRRARRGLEGRRALVFGAGDAGHRLLRGLFAEGTGGITPVGLIDDDPAKARLRIAGVRVLGRRADLAAVVDRTDATLLIIAAPTLEAPVLAELSGRARDLGLDVKVVPAAGDLIDTVPGARDLRDLDLADFLGRTPVHLDTGAIEDQIAGRRVLVTGAGGSIGAELCRQIARFAPGRLFLLDRDESGLQSTQLTLAGHGLLDDDSIILADVRDASRMSAVLRGTRPDLVFHAAALKHLPLLERYPLEAWQTNVLGTDNVLRASAQAQVGTFVNISTDKAADPTSTLGLSKRLGEQLTAYYARTQPGRYVSVRFGNVLGSRGSVIHAFTAQIARGGPVTVTHPDVERYFMLISEACQLVLQAAAIGTDGQVMVLEMGRQIRIVQVARTLIGMSGRRDVEIVYTGLRPGEKLTEQLFSAAEARRATGHPLVDAVDAPPLPPAHLRDMPGADQGRARAWMEALAARERVHPLRGAPRGRARAAPDPARHPSATPQRPEGPQEDREVGAR